VYLIFFEGVDIAKNIVKVGCTEHVKVVKDAVIDKVLEGGWHIGKAEGITVYSKCL
jgi:hypothetical protein